MPDERDVQAARVASLRDAIYEVLKRHWTVTGTVETFKAEVDALLAAEYARVRAETQMDIREHAKVLCDATVWDEVEAWVPAMTPAERAAVAFFRDIARPDPQQEEE